MGDNRPTVGYIIVHAAMGPQSWSKEEKRLYTSTGAQLFPHLPAARQALNDTIEFAMKRKYGWKVKDYEVIRCVSPRS